MQRILMKKSHVKDHSFSKRAAAALSCDFLPRIWASRYGIEWMKNGNNLCTDDRSDVGLSETALDL